MNEMRWMKTDWQITKKKTMKNIIHKINVKSEHTHLHTQTKTKHIGHKNSEFCHKQKEEVILLVIRVIHVIFNF